ncbi:MAG: hypothetical protein CL846_10745 [Crocinitomicaceae bacterium]|nr:hypothetical protein [Crocinitomicaceae bacterium]|tara:strand:+ start:495 stop:2060 length:1566 start_codon:yes stop_codon:yes gene_type:complete
MKRIYFLILIVVVFFKCKKNDTNTSWNATYNLPISYGNIDVLDFLDSNKLSFNSDSSHLIFKDTKTVFELNQEDFLDAIEFSFEDTMDIPSVIYGIPFSPGFSIPYTFVENKQFSFSDMELKTISFNTLQIEYLIRSNISGAVDFEFSFPNIYDINNNTITQTVLIPYDSSGNSSVTGYIDLENTLLDLSGNNGNSYNEITTEFKLGASSTNTSDLILTSESEVIIDIKLKNLSIKKAIGYLGKINLDSQDEIELSIMDEINAKNINIGPPSLSLNIINGVGVDAQLKIKEITFSKNNDQVSIVHPMINNTININRALDLGWDFQSSNYSIDIDSNNSNIQSVISLLPNKVINEYEIITNPLGNISGHNDFYNSNNPLKVNLDVEFPLLINIDSLVFLRDIPLELPENFNLKNGEIFIEFQNSFPFEVCAEINILNGNTIGLNPTCVNSGVTNSNGEVTSATNNFHTINLNESDISDLSISKHIQLKLKLSTPTTNMDYSILESNKLFFKIGGYFETEINL